MSRPGKGARSQESESGPDPWHVQPELHAQRVLNRGRVPEIARYITDNPESYVLSSIVDSVDRKAHFEPVAGSPGAAGMGTLRLPIAARFLIHDGIHRRAAIEEALRLKPELADETVSLVLYVDPGFERSEQIFSDLKRHESRSSRSQGILCDNRDEMALITKELIRRVDAFDGMTEMVRSKISNRSLKLFTLSGIYHATEILLAQKQKVPFAEKLALATQFWTEVSDRIPDWGRASAARSARQSSGRRAFIRMRSPCRPWPGRDVPFSRSVDRNGEHDWRRSGSSTGRDQIGSSGRAER